MVATVNGFGIVSADILLPTTGIWTAEVRPVDDAVLSKGDKVSIVVGDMTLSGTITNGRMGEVSSSFFVVGGSGGWRKSNPYLAYQDGERGIKLEDVVYDLAKFAGETVSSFGLASRTSFDTIVLNFGISAVTLSDLSPFRVLPSGDTVVGLEKRSKSDAIVSVKKDHPSIGMMVVEFPDDEVSSVVPGTIFSVGSSDVSVEESRIVVRDGTIFAEVHYRA